MRRIVFGLLFFGCSSSPVVEEYPPCSCGWLREVIVARRDPLATWDEIVVPEDDLVFVDDGPGTGVDGRYGPEIREPSREEHFDSDWEHTLEQMAEAGEGSNGQDLAQTAKLNEIQTNEAKARAPHRNPNPSSWACGVLGATVTLTTGVSGVSGANGPEQGLVYWEGTEDQSCPVTITLAPPTVLPPASTGYGAAKIPVGHIRWGSYGAIFEALVDFGLGTQFTLNASSVYVGAYLETGSSGNLEVRGNIGFFSKSQVVPVTRTIIVNQSTNAVTVNRPRFATSVWFLRTTVTDQYTLQFSYSDGDSITPAYTRILAASTYLTEPVPLANDVTSITATNNTSTPILARFVFNLF